MRTWSSWNFCILLVRVENGIISLENWLAVVNKVKLTVTSWFSNSSLRDTPKRNESVWPQKTCSEMFIATLFIKTKNGNSRMKLCYSHRKEQYWGRKGNQVCCTWKMLKCITLSQRFQHQSFCMNDLYDFLGNGKTIRMDNRPLAARGWGSGYLTLKVDWGLTELVCILSVAVITGI